MHRIVCNRFTVRNRSGAVDRSGLQSTVVLKKTMNDRSDECDIDRPNNNPPRERRWRRLMQSDLSTGVKVEVGEASTNCSQQICHIFHCLVKVDVR